MQANVFLFERGMKMKNPFKSLTKFEWGLWISSVVVVTVSFVLYSTDYLTLTASLIGVTALIFISKGMVFGQILCVIFAVFYGIVSYFFAYYGEMITYLCMSGPIALMSVISWIKHPFEKSEEVEVNRMTKKQIVMMMILTAGVTGVFYFILEALGNANLLLSTFSIATSFAAAYMTFVRSAYYGVGYAINDLVLIGLWTYATMDNISYMPMTVCFGMFFINDIYGFINWQRMKKRQNKN